MNQRKVNAISFKETKRKTELENSENKVTETDRQPVISSHAEVGHLTEGEGCYFRALLEIKAGDKALDI